MSVQRVSGPKRFLDAQCTYNRDWRWNDHVFVCDKEPSNGGSLKSGTLENILRKCQWLTQLWSAWLTPGRSNCQTDKTFDLLYTLLNIYIRGSVAFLLISSKLILRLHLFIVSTNIALTRCCLCIWAVGTPVLWMWNLQKKRSLKAWIREILVVLP